ncbi:hypothetical protein C8J56DRAFT_1063682 [Mycena floridula]|nr:hypothetical protein C8J56DRAFT_1063682 [Mycena floridula]
MFLAPAMFSTSNMLKSIKPTKYTVRDPRRMSGNRFCITATFSVESNFIRRMFGKTVDEHQIQVGETGVNIWLQAISVACADITSIFASVAAA